MKKFVIIAALLLPLFIISCTKENLVTPPDQQVQQGKLLLKFDKANAPSSVVSIAATLSRTGYDTLSKSMNLKSDSTADITFSSIAIGTWHLKVDAKSQSGTILYSGEDDVDIIENFTSQVNLTLTPTGQGVGNLQINVCWGSSSKWFDYYQNPIFTSKDSPANPYGGVSTSKVIYDNGIFKMWYLNTLQSGHGDVGYSESSDGVYWKKVCNGSVLTPGPMGSWDDYTVGPGAIIKENGMYKMYYIGWHGQYDNWHIGLAVSQDGITWQKYPNPVLYGSGSEAQIGIADLVKSGSTYYMFYSSRGLDYSDNRINVATSTDGVNFTRYSGNPILTYSQPWEGGAITFPSVIFDNGQFKLLYMNLSGSGFGLATSQDGLHWTKDNNNPVFKASDAVNHWCEKIAYPYWRKIGNQYRLYYTGQLNGINYICLATKAY